MLLKKMFRDMGKNKMQFISIFLMAFLGVYIFTGVGGEWAGIEATRKGYYADTNLADGWIWGENLTKDDMAEIRKLDGVKDVQRRFYIETTGSDSNKPVIYLYGLENNEICMPYIAEGEEFDASSADKIWLDIQFAKAKNIKVGDSYTISFQGTDMTKTVAGLIYSSEYQYYANENDLWPDYNNIGFAYCSVNALPFKDYIINTVKSDEYTVRELAEMFLTEDQIRDYSKVIDSVSKDFLVRILEKEDNSEFISNIPYDQIIITTDSNAKSLDTDIQSILGDRYAVYTSRSETSGIQMLNSEVEQHKMIGSVFPIAFMLVAILAIITGMNRLINNQRIQIGTLGALGFSKTAIIIHYVGYGFWMSLFGAAAGLLIGPVTLPYAFYSSMASYYTLPQWRPGWDISFVLVAAATVAACSLTSFFTVIAIVKDAPAQALRPKAPKKIKLTAIERSSLWRKTGFNLRWNLRDFRRGKVKTLMGVVGTVSCMALLVCAFCCYDSMADMEKWMYDEIQICNTRITLDDSTRLKQAEKISADVSGELIETQAIEVQANGIKATANLTVCEGKGIYNITDTNRIPAAPDDDTVALSKKVAEKLGIDAGDKIKWHIYTSSNWVESAVTIIDRVPMSQGMVITRNTLEKSGYDFEPDYIDTMEAITEYKSDAVNNVLTRDDMHTFWTNYMETMNMMVAILILFAAILAVVVLYNMGLLSFTERQRELVTLKVIGFQSVTLRNLNVVQNLILSLIGVALGVPAGKALVKMMLDSAGDEFDMMVSLSFSSFLISAVVTVGVSLLVSLLFSKKLRELDMVSALKGVE